MKLRACLLAVSALAALAACSGKKDKDEAKTDAKAGASSAASASPSGAAAPMATPAPGAAAQPAAAEMPAGPAAPIMPGASIPEAAALPMGATAAAEIKTRDQKSFFKVVYSGQKRDLVRIRMANKSLLKPEFKIYNALKSQIADKYDGTEGASAEYQLAMKPGDTIYVEVVPYGSSMGAYELSVTPMMAFDAFETNDDILSASPAEVGKTIEANVMDGADEDFYHFTGATGKTVHVVFDNQSTTLKPEVKFYTAAKSSKGEKYDGTPGANLDYDLEIEPGKDFYLQVTPYNSMGKYKLTVTNK